MNLVGKTFGNLTVVKDTGIRDYGIVWFCKCKCGKTNNVCSAALNIGNTSSCGCLGSKDRINTLATKHGETAKGIQTSEYMIYHGMIQRCYNHKHISYKNYGGRGIKVCKRWLDSFENFLKDVGRKPTNKHTLDRINNNGNYEPSNIRWATYLQQADNRRPKCFPC
jgi:hypothetical protein